MAKSLPYFKFIVSEWNDGDIILCSLAAQGLFTNLCSLYWSKEGELSLEKCKRKYNCPDELWKELEKEGAIKITADRIVINFLDEQFKERGKQSETNSKNVKKRWDGTATVSKMEIVQPEEYPTKKEKNFQAPTIDHVKEFFKENGYTEASGEKAFRYYAEANWHDSQGKKIKNWKQKMRGVWFKEENLIVAKPPSKRPTGWHPNDNIHLIKDK
jgi:hypothetical protein